MRRIISCIVIILSLLFTVTISSYAAGPGGGADSGGVGGGVNAEWTNDINYAYVFKDTLDFSRLREISSDYVLLDVYARCANSFYVDGIYIDLIGERIYYYPESGSRIIVYSNSKWSDSAYQHLTFTNTYTFSSTIATWLYLYLERISDTYNYGITLYDTFSSYRTAYLDGDFIYWYIFYNEDTGNFTQIRANVPLAYSTAGTYVATSDGYISTYAITVYEAVYKSLYSVTSNQAVSSTDLIWSSHDTKTTYNDSIVMYADSYYKDFRLDYDKDQNDGGFGGGSVTDPDSPSNPDNSDDNTFLGNILGFLTDIADNIRSLPSKISSGLFSILNNFTTNLSNALNSIGSAISDAFNAIVSPILEGIKNIFIPNTMEIDVQFSSFVQNLKEKFGFNTDFFDSLLVEGTPVSDVTADYNVSGVGSFKFKFLDSSFINQAVEYFRPIIRGFIVLLLCFFNIKMLLSFIRQDAGVITGKAVDAEMKARKND